MRDFLKVYLPITLVVIAGFALAWHFVDPAPPRAITIATGSPAGSYTAFGERYRSMLAESGIKAEIRHTRGSEENIALLQDPASKVDVAFVQGGIGNPPDQPRLRSLASVFHEPLWVLVRGFQVMPETLNDLRGQRIGIGAAGSGTRILAENLLKAAGVDDASATLVSVSSDQTLDMLTRGELDAAFFVIARPTDAMRAVIARPEISIMNFRQAEALKRRYGYLSAVNLPQGVLDLARPLPPRDTALVAPTASLVVRDDLHPAIQDLLLGAAHTIHAAGDLTTTGGMFPSQKFTDFPLSDDAVRYFKSGPTFLRRVLPFEAAIQAERLMIMLIPLLTLMFPLFKIAPPFYRWNVRRRIFRWYRDLREIEKAWNAGADRQERRDLLESLDRIQTQVGTVQVPLAYADDLYHLRLHIAFVQQRLTEPPAESAAAAESG